jgi:hypothetical protein
MRWWLVILSLMLVTAAPVAIAQERAVESLFPDAKALGDGWVASAAQDSDVTQWPAWSRFSARIYVGPEGSRALVGRMEPSGDVPAALELASGMFDEYLGRFTVDPVSENRLAGTAPVDGCVSMRRVDGYDAVVPSIPVGLSLCQAEGGVIVMTYASGGPGDAPGHELSDHLLGLVLEQG